MLEAAGFQFARDTRKALKRTRQALNATRADEPDHPVRLKAAETIFKLAGLHEPQEQTPSHQSLTIVWNLSANEVPPAGLHTGRNSIASGASNGSPSSSVIEDGERPPSA